MCARRPNAVARGGVDNRLANSAAAAGNEAGHRASAG